MTGKVRNDRVLLPFDFGPRQLNNLIEILFCDAAYSQITILDCLVTTSQLPTAGNLPCLDVTHQTSNLDPTGPALPLPSTSECEEWSRTERHQCRIRSTTQRLVVLIELLMRRPPPQDGR